MNSQQKTLRSQWAAVLVALAWLLVWPGTKTNAQQARDNQSHRVLQLPESASADIGQQIQTMLGLSKFVERKEEQQAQSLIKELNPDQLQALAEFMKLLPQQPGVQPYLANRLAEQLESDPQLRRTAQEVLEQFARERRLPSLMPGGGSPFPWLPNKARRDGDSSGGDDQPPNDNSTADKPFSDDPRWPFGEPQTNSERGIQEALLREVARRWNGRDRAASVPTMSDFWEQARRDPSALPDISSLDLPDSLSSRSQARSNPNQDGSSPLGGRSGGDSDYRQMRDALNNLREVMPDQIEQRLQRNGVTKTLKEIMQQAKNEVRWQPTDQPTSESVEGQPGAEKQLFAGWESAILKAVSESATEISEMAKELKAKAGKPGTGQVSKASSPSAGTSGKATPGNAIFTSDTSGKPPASANASKPADNFLSTFTKPPAPSSPTASGTDGESGRMSGLSVPLELLVAAVILTGVGLYFFFAGRPEKDREQTLALETAPGMQIRGRGDVIRAFHLLTTRSLNESHNWWTHRQAASTLGAQQPNWQLAIDHLADIYEHARYLPKDAMLTAEQLRAAQRAWEHCNA
jgi:hypothetical protein